jgi:hypothetical protein
MSRQSACKDGTFSRRENTRQCETDKEIAVSSFAHQLRRLVTE